MAAIINTVYPSYNNTGNYSGVNASVRSAGAVSNIAQADAVTSLEREGRLGLSQFGFIKLPREVLFLQEERSAKVKVTQQGDQVASSNETDLDDERSLEKIDDHTDKSKRFDALKAHREKQAQAENAQPQAKDAAKAKEAADTARHDTTQKQQISGQNTHSDPAQDQAFASLLGKHAASESRNESSARKPDEGRKARPSVVGSPAAVYTTIHATTNTPAPGEEHQSLDVRA